MYHEMHFWIFTQSRQNIVDIGLTFKKRTCQSEIDYLFYQVKKDLFSVKYNNKISGWNFILEYSNFADLRTQILSY